MAQNSLAAKLGGYQGDVDKALASIARDRIVPRIWDRDHTVWKQDPTEIANRLGWLHSISAMSQGISRLKGLLDSVRLAGHTRALLLGMGGSSLAAEVFRKAFGVGRDCLDLAILDSTNPGAVLSVDKALDPKRTLFIVSTKSGTTVETLSLFNYFYGKIAAEVGFDKASDHFVAITDPGGGLARMATELRFRDTFLNDPNIGGRYSALSYFGLVPAVLAGIDIEKLLHRAQAMADCCRPDADAAENPAVVLGTILGRMALAGRDKMTMIVSPELESLGDWVEQLVAESTGKENRGILPVVGEAIGLPDVYGQDRLFVHIRLPGDDSMDAALNRLRAVGHPVVSLNLSDLYDLGGQFFLWEMATVVASHVIGVNPFDQPDVESAKVLAREMVAQHRKTSALPESGSVPLAAGSIQKFLDQARPGDYIALQAYLQPTIEMDAALKSLRCRLRDRYRLATTVGYGPRFLHSTGQLHKGDAGRGLFVQFTGEPSRDLPIPDRAGSNESSISFGVLQAAQARGDAQALKNAGRRVITCHLQGDPVMQLRKLERDLA